MAKLPARTFVLDRPGLARVLSLPLDRDNFASDIISSYRVKQGVLHNPRSDRRTTQGIFHIAEGGLPIPDDKLGVPKHVRRTIAAARARSTAASCCACRSPPRRRSRRNVLSRCCCGRSSAPKCPDFTPEKTMEIRFFAPGNLVSNLDFVESIFGNGGDPFLPENDAGLDVEHWTGHTGCVILAPHLVKVTKKAARPAALGRGHRTPAPRRHVLEKRARNSTTTAGLSSSPAATNAASSSPSSPTIISAIARRR